MKRKGRAARLLLASQSHGILATHSRDVLGYPYGSVIPYCLNGDGHVYFLASVSAHYTRNFKMNPKVSLTVVEGYSGNLHQYGRLICMAEVKPIREEIEAHQEHFFRYFPSLSNFHHSRHFLFYALIPVCVHYIGGFGQVFWLEPEEFVFKNPFFGEPSREWVRLFNKQHKDALIQYCAAYKRLEILDETCIHLAGIDREGFDMLIGEIKFRFPFMDPIFTLEEAVEKILTIPVSK